MKDFLVLLLQAVLGILVPRKWWDTDHLRDEGNQSKSKQNQGAASQNSVKGTHPTFTRSDIAAMTATVYAEARNQGDIGMEAVANVILNRIAVNPKHWGFTPEAVCRKPWQFSCWNDDDPQSRRVKQIYDTVKENGSDESVYDAYCAVQRVLSGQSKDPTHGATHYYNPRAVKKTPDWADTKDRTVIIGDHIFYKLEA